MPTQTLCNRSFVHAGTSSGYVNNEWKTGGFPPDDILINDSTTLENLLENAGVPFRVYYDSPTKFLCNALVGQEKNLKYGIDLPFFPRRIYPLSQFWTDVQQESTFPSYVFLEPNFINNPWTGPENDEHPDAGLIDLGPPSSVLFGEQLLAKIYNALAASPAWDSTLFIIIFDEHGGTFDHYPPGPPGSTVSPDGIVIPVTTPGGSSFPFDRYGVRIPAVLVSPLIPAGTICNSVFDHTSVIKTVLNCFGVNETLLAREQQALDVSEVLTLSKPRTDRVTVTPTPVPDVDTSTMPAGKPLNGAQRSMLKLAIRRAAHEVGAGALADLVEPKTHGEAHAVIAALRKVEGLL